MAADVDAEEPTEIQPLHAIVHAANVQDRDGGLLLLATLFGKFPFLQKLLADSGYQGPIFAHGLAKILPYLKTEIIVTAQDVCLGRCAYHVMRREFIRICGS